RSTTSATCCRASSTRAPSTSTRRSTARRSCAATAGWAAWRWGWGPTSTGAAARPAGRCSTAGGASLATAPRGARPGWECNQARVPILFFQDVNGFMVGRDSGQEGIIKAGAKLVNAISNSVVPKLTVILGGSFGAGNYALCGKAFDPRFLFAWPTARYAVMGGDQAASTLLDVQVNALNRGGHAPAADELEELRRKVSEGYQEQTDVRYAAARLWVDAILNPAETRATLLTALDIATRYDDGRPFRTGVFQV